MADLDLASIFKQIIGDNATNAPGALAAASAGEREAADLQRKRLDEGESFLRNYDNGRVNLPLLAGFGALMGPTKTGSFGESLSNAIEKGGGVLQQQRREELDRFDKLQRIQEGRAKLAAEQGLLGMNGINRGFGMLGKFDEAQGVLANANLDQAITAMKAGLPIAQTGNAPASPVGQAPVSPLASLTDTPAPTPSPFGTLPISRPGAPPMPSAGPMTSTPPEMNAPGGTVIGGDRPASSPAPVMPTAPAAPAPQGAPAPAAAQRPAPAARAQAPGSDEDAPYAGETLTPDAITEIEQARQLKALAAANPRAANAAKYASAADAIIKKYVPDGWYFDPTSKRILPTGKESIGYQAAVEGAKQKAKQPDRNDTFYQKAEAGQAERFGKMVEELPNIQTSAAKTQALAQQLDKLPTGWEGKSLALLSNYGIKTRYSSAIEAADALTSAMLPAQRQGMPGAVSDKDMAIFKSALPKLMNTPEGNRIIVSTMQMVNDYNMKLAQLASKALNREMSPQDAERQMRELSIPLKQYLGEEGNFTPGGNKSAGAPQQSTSAAPRYMARNPKTGQTIYSDDGNTWRNSP